MNLAACVLLALVFGLVAFDCVTFRGRNRRLLVIEIAAFIAGAFFIAFPHRATELAHFVGIGRGVDFFLYPIVIWLVRESLLSRRRRQEDAERITQLVRALAIARSSLVADPAAPPHP
jgi:hypothetical protein